MINVLVQTQESFCKSPEYAYLYAKEVDKCPREDTRKAACVAPYFSYKYALEIDTGPVDITREIACKNAFFAYLYAQDIDKCIREDTWLAVKGTGYEKEYRKFFNELAKEDIII